MFRPLRWRLAALFSASALVAMALPGSPSPVFADDGYKLPWTAGITFTITQGWNQGDHIKKFGQEFAYDFGMPDGTPVLASKGGTVLGAVGTNPADACGPDSSFVRFTNYVVVDQGDGTSTLYLHLSPGLAVQAGQPVVTGQLLGQSGHTGWTVGSGPNGCGPHLHFQREVTPRNANHPYTNSQPVYFGEYPGQQLKARQSVTSQNQPSPSGVIVKGTVREAHSLRPVANEWVDANDANNSNSVPPTNTNSSGQYSFSFTAGAGDLFEVSSGDTDAGNGYFNRNKSIVITASRGTNTVDMTLPTLKWSGYSCNRASNTCSIHAEGFGYFPNTIGVTLNVWLEPAYRGETPIGNVAVDSNGHFNRTITFPKLPNGTYSVTTVQEPSNGIGVGAMNANARPTNTFISK